MNPPRKAKKIDLSHGDVHFDVPPMGIYIGWGGRLTISVGGTRLVLVKLKKGTLLTIMPNTIHKRGTSCRNMVALYAC